MIDLSFLFSLLDCLPGWILFESNCYLLFKDDFKSWYNAEIDCLNHNAHLLYILSAEEEEFIASQLIDPSTVTAVFIGLIENAKSSERFIGWSTGDNLTYTNWHKTPTVIYDGAACVTKDYRLNGQWETVSCLKPLPYICKRKGRLVLFTQCFI